MDRSQVTCNSFRCTRRPLTTGQAIMKREKVEGASVFDPAYTACLEGLAPFPDDEYQQLTEYYFDRRDPMFRNTRAGPRLLSFTVSRLQEMKYNKLYERILTLRVEHNLTAALVLLRMLRRYQVRLGEVGQHRFPWEPPTLESTDLTGGVVDLTGDDDEEDIPQQPEVIDVEEFVLSMGLSVDLAAAGRATKKIKSENRTNESDSASSSSSSSSSASSSSSSASSSSASSASV